jgi:hypothetical protein
MKRQTGHPDVEALANFRAGLVEGIRGRRIAAHVARCERCAQLSDQLSAVTWALASVPVPSLPDAVEQRISAAIAAEVAARQVASLTANSMADPSAATSPAPAGPAATEPRHARRWFPRRALGSVGSRLRPSPVQVLASVTACLLLAGLGYLLSVPRASGTPSSAAAPSGRSAAASGAAPHSRGPRRAISPTTAIGPPVGSNSAAFLVTVSSIRYRKSTLRAQVSSQLAQQTLAPVITGTPGSQSNKNSPGNQAGGASQSNTTRPPSGQLVGCVLNLTRGAQPALVQLATYQAESAYVIAVPGRAWVVHPSCTAAKPALITTIALAPAR